MSDTRAPDRRRFWKDRGKGEWQCPNCGRTRGQVDRVDVHHRDENKENGHPDNLRGRCKYCHLGGEHDRDVDAAEAYAPRGPRSTGPRRPRSLGPGR